MWAQRKTIHSNKSQDVLIGTSTLQSSKISSLSMCYGILKIPEKRHFWTSGCYVDSAKEQRMSQGTTWKPSQLPRLSWLVVTKVAAVCWVLGGVLMQETGVSRWTPPTPSPEWFGQPHRPSSYHMVQVRSKRRGIRATMLPPSLSWWDMLQFWEKQKPSQWEGLHAGRVSFSHMMGRLHFWKRISC